MVLSDVVVYSRLSVHTFPEEFINTYSFVKPLGLRSRPEEFENAGFEFSCGRKTFLNTIGSGEARDFPGRDFLKQKYKTTGDRCVFKFLQCSVDDRA